MRLALLQPTGITATRLGASLCRQTAAKQPGAVGQIVALQRLCLTLAILAAFETNQLAKLTNDDAQHTDAQEGQRQTPESPPPPGVGQGAPDKGAQFEQAEQRNPAQPPSQKPKASPPQRLTHQIRRHLRPICRLRA